MRVHPLVDERERRRRRRQRSVNVTTTGGCAWTATSNSGFLSIQSGSGGTGSGSVSYNATANGTNFRSGTLTIGGQTFSIYQFGTGPFVSLDRPSLRYGATNSGGVDLGADLGADGTADADRAVRLCPGPSRPISHGWP